MGGTEPSSDPTAPRAADRLRHVVLVVDDEPDILDSVASILRMEVRGLEIVTASRASDALEQLAKRDVDLMVTDFKMPGMDGFELVRRARELSPDTRILMMTGYGSPPPSPLVDGDPGIRYIVSKPLKTGQFLSLVQAAMMDDLSI